MQLRILLGTALFVAAFPVPAFLLHATHWSFSTTMAGFAIAAICAGISALALLRTKNWRASSHVAELTFVVVAAFLWALIALRTANVALSHPQRVVANVTQLEECTSKPYRCAGCRYRIKVALPDTSGTAWLCASSGLFASARQGTTVVFSASLAPYTYYFEPLRSDA
jgi:hypothetical protein